MQKVILIMSFSTQETEYENQPRPEFCWTNPQGELLGIWDMEFSDIMLKRLVNHYPDYDCEIWQPELRADKIYSARLQERLTHSKFPASLLKVRKRFKTIQVVYSEDILAKVRDYDNENTVFMLPAAVYNKWLAGVIAAINEANIIYYNLLNNGVLLPSSINTANPFKALNRGLINLEKYLWLKKMRVLLTPNTEPQAVKQLKTRYPQMSIYELKWGLDQEFWQRVITRDEARSKLGIDPGQYVVLLSQRLVPEYQLDRFIEAVAGVRTNKNFQCFISGHGSQDYQDYLRQLVIERKLDDKITFIGFVSDEELRAYLIAADLFATLPLVSAGSGSALKAMAVGTPVLLTTSCGESYHFLREHSAGSYVQPYDYDAWRETINELINGKEIRTVPRDEVLARYNDKYTADSINIALNHWS